MAGENVQPNNQPMPVIDARADMHLFVPGKVAAEPTATFEDFRSIAEDAQDGTGRASSYVYGGAWLTLVRRYDPQVHNAAGLMLPMRQAWYDENYAGKPYPVRFLEAPEPNPDGMWSERELRSVGLLVVSSLQQFLTLIDGHIAETGDDSNKSIEAFTGPMKIGASKLALWRAVVDTKLAA